VSATSSYQNVATPLRPLAETAALFRQECSALDHLVEDLYRDVEQLRDELVRKGDELEDSRRRLAERGSQLTDQRKDNNRLLELLEQQEKRLGEALTELKSLREQSKHEREESKERESARFAFLEQKLRAAESERDQMRHEVNVLQATAAKSGSKGNNEALAPLMAELGDMKRQLSDTQAQLGDARTQLAAAIQQSASSSHSATIVAGSDGQFDRERVELESELELVRTRATELQEVVNQQRRELVEQRADVTTELRLLREMVEQRKQVGEVYEHDEEPLVAASHAASHNEPVGSAPDPVVSSVMAQFARLQKDVAQRRKKK